METAVPSGGLGAGVAALLSELIGLLEVVAGGGPSATIDLRSLPMSPQDRVKLQSALGDGEVKATLDADGFSTLRETRVSGVWWIEHLDRHGELIAELLEVARVPPILESVPEEIAVSARELREQLSIQSAAPAREMNHATRQ
jgi:HupH hydrogenase expression protein, C-terminal conserved region